MQRIKFKEVKRQAAEILQVEGDEQKANKLINDYFKQMQIEDANFRASRVTLINEEEKVNKIYFNNEEDIKFFMDYYENVYSKRPEMTKEDSEQEKDYDFFVDLERYNPWDEYKQIYSGIYKKGKTHWLLKKMPEWKFLQIGEVNADEDIATSVKNRLRGNVDDSIFTAIHTDRYFNERLKKEGTYRGRSQSIRI